MYAAIPTMYRGIQMRSRLEAKWAFVFDELLIWGVDIMRGEAIDGTMAVGWRMLDSYSWWPETELCSPDRLNVAWMRATNGSQYRRAHR